MRPHQQLRPHDRLRPAAGLLLRNRGAVDDAGNLGLTAQLSAAPASARAAGRPLFLILLLLRHHHGTPVQRHRLPARRRRRPVPREEPKRRRLRGRDEPRLPWAALLRAAQRRRADRRRRRCRRHRQLLRRRRRARSLRGGPRGAVAPEPALRRLQQDVAFEHVVHDPAAPRRPRRRRGRAVAPDRRSGVAAARPLRRHGRSLRQRRRQRRRQPPHPVEQREGFARQLVVHLLDVRPRRRLRRLDARQHLAAQRAEPKAQRRLRLGGGGGGVEDVGGGGGGGVDVVVACGFAVRSRCEQHAVQPRRRLGGARRRRRPRVLLAHARRRAAGPAPDGAPEEVLPLLDLRLLVRREHEGVGALGGGGRRGGGLVGDQLRADDGGPAKALAGRLEGDGAGGLRGLLAGRLLHGDGEVVPLAHGGRAVVCTGRLRVVGEPRRRRQRCELAFVDRHTLVLRDAGLAGDRDPPGGRVDGHVHAPPLSAHGGRVPELSADLIVAACGKRPLCSALAQSTSSFVGHGEDAPLHQ
eukprot:Rhum_TRINITY_DN8959_c0_g1::Rhum_TRINITY_DN8959_c0_g1_i1::g.30840::m.30840